MPAIPLVTVNTNICYNDGSVPEGAEVCAVLQSVAQNADGYIVPKEITTTVQPDGSVSLNLWPNCNGAAETFYEIKLKNNCLGDLLNVIAIVPESTIPLELEDIALPVNSLSLGQSSGNVSSTRKVDTGEGLKGGGDLSTNRTHELDLTTIVNQEVNPTPDMIIPIQDPNVPCNIRYIPIANLPGLNNVCISIESIAQAGQTEILIQNTASSSPSNIDLFVEGRRQPPGRYTRDIINQPPYNLRITLPEPLEGGEELEVVIKENCDVGNGVDAADVTYSGGGSVEDALNLLFASTGASPWQSITGNYAASSADRLFVDTSTGTLSITLPASPSVGDSVEIVDVTPAGFITNGDLNNEFTVLRNGNLIMEVADDLIVDQGRISIIMIYAGTAFGWRIKE